MQKRSLISKNIKKEKFNIVIEVIIQVNATTTTNKTSRTNTLKTEDKMSAKNVFT